VITCNSDFCGPNSNEKKCGKPTQAALRLLGPVSKTKRNITAYVWFYPQEAVYILIHKGLTFVALIKKYKRATPTEFLRCRNKEIGNSVCGFVKNKQSHHLSLRRTDRFFSNLR
jgi:hypothetical protein